MKVYSFDKALEQPSAVTRLLISGIGAKDFIPRLYKFTELEWLYICQTDVVDLPEITLPNLRTLIFSCNKRLTCLPVAITKWQNIETLEVIDRNLKKIPEQISELKQLKRLVLKCPKLQQVASLAKAFANWPHLEFLDLRCPFDTIPSSIQYLKALKRMEISFMRDLVELPDVFGKLPNLELLSVYIAGLTRWPQSISSLERLKQLYIKDCPLSTLPISLPPSLEKLTITGTKITSIPINVFQHPTLKEIDFSGNQIMDVQVSTRCRKTPFEIINLSSNAIKQLPDAFFKLKIKDLIIDENPLLPETEKMLKQTFPGIDIIPL